MEEEEQRGTESQIRKNSSYGRNYLKTKIQGNLAYGGGWGIKFFHRLTNSHTSSNFIGNFEVDGVMLRVENQVNECIVSFYENLYDKLC